MNRYIYRAYLEQDKNNLYILRDNQGKILSYIEMDSYDKSSQNFSYEDLVRLLHMPYVSFNHRICILNPDDSIRYQIPFEDIPKDGISYNEVLQDGQRKTLSVKLINKDGKYTPSTNSQKGYYSMFYENDQDYSKENKYHSQYVLNKNYSYNAVWGSIRMSYDIGLKINETDYIWFKKGVFRVSSITDSYTNNIKEVNISLKDKFSIFEGNTGKLITPVEIPTGSDCKMLIKDMLNEDFGDGYSYDMLDREMFDVED